jgi:hypothetical protein
MAKAAVALSGARSVGRPRKEGPYLPPHRMRALVAAGMLDGRWGSWLGGENAQGRVSDEQWQAALRFAEAGRAYQRAIASPGYSAKAQDLNAVSGRSVSFETDGEVKRNREAVAEWDRLINGLTDLQFHALDVIVLQWRPNESFNMKRALHEGLNKLVAMWKTPRRKR